MNWSIYHQFGFAPLLVIAEEWFQRMFETIMKWVKHQKFSTHLIIIPRLMLSPNFCFSCKRRQLDLYAPCVMSPNKKSKSCGYALVYIIPTLLAITLTKRLVFHPGITKWKTHIVPATVWLISLSQSLTNTAVSGPTTADICYTSATRGVRATHTDRRAATD